MKTKVCPQCGLMICYKEIKDWRKSTCGECGWWITIGCRKSQRFPKDMIVNSQFDPDGSDPACPDFEPRDIPDPEYPDERTNMDHITPTRPEDRQ